MFPSFSELESIFSINPLLNERLMKSGLAIYPIKADQTTQEYLERYHDTTSAEERCEIERRLILENCFHREAKACETYLSRRGTLLEKIENIQMGFEKRVSQVGETELFDLEKVALELDQEMAKSIWMTDSEMQVHRERQDRGFAMPPTWNQLVSLVRKDYCRFADVIYGKIQMHARTIGGCDEFRFDMLRYVTCLLKYYGFRVEGEKITYGNSGISFSYMLLNPTWEHLENEVRADLVTAGVKEEELPMRYPDTPTVPASPLKDVQSHNDAVTFTMLGISLAEQANKDNPFF